MMTRTEEIEQTRRQVRLHDFERAERVLICLEIQADRRKCLRCVDYALCERMQKTITRRM